MAFENVRAKGEGLKATSLKVGESLTGYVTAIDTYNYDGKDLVSIAMQLEDGKGIKLYPAGSINYDIKDGRLKVGFLTRITRLEDQKTKRGNKRTNFNVEQDRTMVYSELDAAGVTSDAATSVTSIKEKAAKLQVR